jgi:glycosyltransferase involved in cell wall biosynthesis
MKKKINILFITDGIWYSYGAERHLYNLSKNLDKTKFNCLIIAFTIKGDFVEKFRKAGIKVIHVPIDRIYTPSAIMRAITIHRIIRDNRIDIVQTYHFMADTLGVMVSKLSGVKHIVSSRRDTGDKKTRRQLMLNRLVNRWIEKFIAVCDRVGQRLTIDEKVPPSKQITIYNGIKLSKYDMHDMSLLNSLRNRFGISDKDFVVGMIANFRPEKNYDVFLRAVKDAKKKIKSLKVFAVGEGPTIQSCKAYCEENDMIEYVYFPGMVTDVREYIAVLDIACLVPGANEGFSNAILECMAMGKPMIVSDVGGNSEAVPNGINGIVIPPLDHEELSKSITYLYENEKLRVEMGKKSRERVEQHFTLDKMVLRHEQLYEELVYS